MSGKQPWYKTGRNKNNVVADHEINDHVAKGTLRNHCKTMLGVKS